MLKKLSSYVLAFSIIISLINIAYAGLVYKGTHDFSGATLLGAGETKCSINPETTQLQAGSGTDLVTAQWDILHRSYHDGEANIVFWQCMVPAGATGISSITVTYRNQSASTNVLVGYTTAHLRPTAQTTITQDGTYQGVGNAETQAVPAGANWEYFTVPADAYDALANIEGGSQISVELTRYADEAGDTYNADWLVATVTINFS